jgi:multidrug efflux pump subunit AcrA (membrane-fusion protein)
MKKAILKQGMGATFALGATLAVSGCAGTPPHVDDISTAEMALNRALEAEAEEHSPLALRVAREKLDRAKQAMNDTEYEQARRLAEQAQVEAQLAEAQARSQVARQQAQEVQTTIDTLRQEAGEAAGR